MRFPDGRLGSGKSAGALPRKKSRGDFLPQHCWGRWREAPGGVWPTASTQVRLHDRHREPASIQTCFPHPIRPFGPPSPLRGEGETRRPLGSPRRQRQSKWCECGRRAGRNSPSVICITVRRTGRIAPRAPSGRRISFHFLAFPFPNRAFSKACSRNWGPPPPVAARLPLMGDGQALDHPVRRAEFDLRHHPQDDMNSGILEEKVRVMFLWRLRPVGAGLRER
jgi:hypothetical protein